MNLWLFHKVFKRKHLHIINWFNFLDTLVYKGKLKKFLPKPVQQIRSWGVHHEFANNAILEYINQGLKKGKNQVNTQNIFKNNDMSDSTKNARLLLKIKRKIQEDD